MYSRPHRGVGIGVGVIIAALAVALRAQIAIAAPTTTLPASIARAFPRVYECTTTPCMIAVQSLHTHGSFTAFARVVTNETLNATMTLTFALEKRARDVATYDARLSPHVARVFDAHRPPPWRRVDAMVITTDGDARGRHDASSWVTFHACDDRWLGGARRRYDYRVVLAPSTASGATTPTTPTMDNAYKAHIAITAVPHGRGASRKCHRERTRAARAR